MRRILAARRHNGRPEVFVMPPPTPHRTAAAARCRHCGAPLDVLQAALGDTCARPACRHRRDTLLEQQDRQRLADRLRRQLAPQFGPATAAALPVSWIAAHDAQLAPLPADARASLQAHLLQLARDADGDPATADLDDDRGGDDPAPAHAAALCAWCGGRCCRHGRASNAFLEAAQLQRWRQRHPGRSLRDAAAAYLDRLPAHHVEDSCLYHGERGCTLDRDWRADICNRFACEGLQALRQDGAAPARVFVMRAQGRVARLALSTAAGLRPLDPDAPT